MTQTQDPQIAPHSLGIGLVVLLSACFIVSGCAKPNQALTEAPPAFQPTQPPPQVKLPELQRAKLNEVQEAVKRVFKDAAVIDTLYDPNFIAGDFNGDSSQDIAVVLKPAPGKLAQMNEEYPAWILKDPLASNKPATSRLRIEEQDVLLAVIHGYGDNDWRDPQATQTYLLKSAVGSDLKVQTAKDFISTNKGRRIPQLQGDLIGEVVRGVPGYLYYGSATYSWYDPKTFKGEPQRPFVHMARPR